MGFLTLDLKGAGLGGGPLSFEGVWPSRLIKAFHCFNWNFMVQQPLDIPELGLLILAY